MSFDLAKCNKACFGCIKGYKKKHLNSEELKFKISCKGIPKEYVSSNITDHLSEEEAQSALAILDPVTWAATNLDWFCFDPDGEIWKRKNPDEYWDWMAKNPDKPIMGKSRYHRPYQGDMLRCTSKRKIFRIGRQAGKSESMVISMLYHAFTKPGKPENEGFKIVILTPFQSQIEDLFKRLHDYIDRNDDLHNSIKSAAKSPQHVIRLNNGSQIIGFTAGTKSGNNAGSIRGQSADMLVFDEADMLSAEDLNSAFAIITNFPNASLWMSSTPTGKREQFFQNCHSLMWKEFHYPSYVNPMWNDELEAVFRENHTAIGYKHEVEADFGEQEEGVFALKFIEAAKRDFKYGDLKFNSQWIYTIGVDWNDTKIGTTICVLGFNPTVNHFYVVDRHIVRREEFTQLVACQKIAELNQVWHPSVIYIDKGFGATQAEVLRKYGFDAIQDPNRGPKHPDAQLRTIVKQYDFGSKIEVRDLVTKQPIPKAAKPFLVENMIRRFETQSISFPRTDVQLEKELQGYIIDRVSPSGVPVYKPSNEAVGDHCLDALMLAAIGFTLEKSAFGKPQHMLDFAYAKPGEDKKSDFNFEVKQQNQNTRPDMDRSSEISSDLKQRLSSLIIPAANNLNEQYDGVRLWSWPGFLRDEPKPRTLKEFANDEKQTILRPGRPNRRNI